MIAVQNLTKDYTDDGTSTPALRGISFEIRPGEFVAVIGPSGSGKSTLLHILSFLDRPTSGRYTFLGKQMAELSDFDLARIRNKEMGFVFQAFNLIGRATVYENVELPLLYSGVLPSKRKAMVEAAVASVGIPEKLFQEAGKLSGGEKQRAAIARALVNDPAVIFADEPTGNLDTVSGGIIMEIFKKLHQAGRTIVLVTHEHYTAAFAGRVIMLRDGRMAEDKIIPKDGRRAEVFFK